MSSDKQLLANQVNAKKSTGPVSEEGKQIASQNAMKHGLRAADVLLPAEDPQPLEDLRKQLDPRGPMEMLLFDRIVTSAWRLRRAHCIEQGIFRRSGTGKQDWKAFLFMLEMSFSYACQSADAMGKLARYENTLDRGMVRALEQLKRLQAARKGARCADLTESAHLREKLAERTHFQK